MSTAERRQRTATIDTPAT